jgi:hypothetical protein
MQFFNLIAIMNCSWNFCLNRLCFQYFYKWWGCNMSRRIFRSCLKTIEQAVIIEHNQSNALLWNLQKGFAFKRVAAGHFSKQHCLQSPLRATAKETEFKTLIHGDSWTETGDSNSTKYGHIFQKCRSQKAGMKQIPYRWSATNISCNLKKFSRHRDLATRICAPHLHSSLNSKLRVESQLLIMSLNYLQINTIRNFRQLA